jgi:SAM-dependent methyltransferase
LDEENRALRSELTQRVEELRQTQAAADQAHAAAAAAEEARREAQHQLAAARAELQALRNTRTFRATQQPRAVYSRLRGRGTGSDGEISLADEFRRRGPWVTRFSVKGRSYGGDVSFRDDERLAQFLERFGDCKTVLELGSLEGGHTFQLAQHGYRVTGVEGRSENVERARWVGDVLGVDGAEFFVADLESTPLSEFGRFDAVFCCGLLYHLPRPWQLLDQLPGVAPAAFFWTQYAGVAEVEENGIEGAWYGEQGRKDPLSGLSPRSFWMTLPALMDRLRQNGFGRIDVVKDEPTHPHGPAVTLAVWKTVT